MSITSLTTTEEARSGFYPTPPEVADKLLAGIDWDKTESVLEPSAGKGTLVKAVLENYARNAKYSYSSEVIMTDANIRGPPKMPGLKFEPPRKRSGAWIGYGLMSCMMISSHSRAGNTTTLL